MHQLAKDKETVLEMARTMVARAAGYCSDVEFSPMDATRSDRKFVYWMLEQCIDAGATTVNIPDTVGYAIPEEFAAFIKDIYANVSNIHKARISVHCHNDLGLAVANSLAAVTAGARQIETCINGIGERAGNASLEEVAMAIKTRRDFLDVETNINTQELYRTSRMVANLTGMSLQPNKAIVGANAFRHQSGIHQDGILKMRETYEIMDANDIGWPSGGAEIVLGKVSGRHGFKSRAGGAGVRADGRGAVAGVHGLQGAGGQEGRDRRPRPRGDRRRQAAYADRDLPPRLRAGVVRRPRDADGDRAPDRAGRLDPGRRGARHRAGGCRVPRDQPHHRHPERADGVLTSRA